MLMLNELVLEIDKMLDITGIAKAAKEDILARDLENALVREWDKSAKDALAEAIRSLKSGADADAVTQNLETIMGAGFIKNATQPLWQGHYDAFVHGQKTAVGWQQNINFNAVDNRTLKVLDEHNVYWAGTYYNRQFGQDVAAAAQQAITQRMDGRQIGELFEEKFADMTGKHGTKYWRNFANHVVSRSREMGRVNGYQKAGVEYLQIRAVRDHRTTKICKEMDRRVIKVSKAADLRDEILSAASPEEIKKITPWKDGDAVKDVPTGKLDTGLSLPPYHFGCRTRTVAMNGQRLQAWNRAKEMVRGGSVRDQEMAAQLIHQILGSSVDNLKKFEGVFLATKSRLMDSGIFLDTRGFGGVTEVRFDARGSGILLSHGKLPVIDPLEKIDPNNWSVLDATPENMTGVLIHELGHVITDMLPVWERPEFTLKARKLEPISQYSVYWKKHGRPDISERPFAGRSAANRPDRKWGAGRAPRRGHAVSCRLHRSAIPDPETDSRLPYSAASCIRKPLASMSVGRTG